MKLITVEKMKELEATANAAGYSYEKMMQRAGTGLAIVVHHLFFTEEENFAVGLVGEGNNGGDTLVALNELQKNGWICSALLMKQAKRQDSLVEEFESGGGAVFVFEKESTKNLEKLVANSDLLLDGLFGTGFHGPMSAPYSDILRIIKSYSSDSVVVAVDCPSGVDCRTGEVCPETLKADLTVSMEAIKTGMMKMPAFEFCGDLITVELGIPEKNLKAYVSGDEVIDVDLIEKILPERKPDSHKGTYGHLVVCGGSVNYPGAVMMAAKSAYRVGAGLVECAVPERIYEAVSANNLESIFTLMEDEDGVLSENAAPTLVKRLESAECLLLGPGMGREETTQRFIQRALFESSGKTTQTGVGFVPTLKEKASSQTSMKNLSLVIDADALQLLAKNKDWHEHLKASAVLTPHPGEMSALTGLSIEEIQKDRVEIARKYAVQWKQVVVLKGAITVVASTDSRISLMPFASSILAKAGTGDVLAGMIAGFLTQGVPPYEAACLGVWLHAQAALEVTYLHGNEYSLLAGDLIEAIPDALKWIEKSPR